MLQRADFLSRAWRWRGLVAVGALLVPSRLWAGTTGKIAGTVVDVEKAPVVAATVALTGQPFGAFTDAEGRFSILNIPPGTYEVKVSRVGFRPHVVQGVVVSADQTTRIDAQLQSARITAETVVVTAERPPVDVNLTSSMATLQTEEISLLPVQELQDIVNLQAGVVDGHFRGGRLGEVQYQVDGVSINNAYDNTAGLKLDRSLLQEVQVISGTFDAEYGQAMSGVVNAVLKEGGQRPIFEAEVFGGGFIFPGREEARRTEDDFQPLAIRNFTVTASGPSGLPKTTFLANARRYVFEDYVMGQRIFLPTPTYVDTLASLVPTLGDGKEVVLGYSEEWSGAFKITNTSIQDAKASYQVILNDIDSRRANYAFRYNPEALTQQNTFAIAHGPDWTQTLGKGTFLDVALRQNYRTYEDYAYEDPFDPRYDAAGKLYTNPNLPGVYLWGVDLARFEQMTNTYMLKGSLSSQVTPTQLVKTGLDLQLPEVRFGVPGHLVYTTVDGVEGLVRYLDNPPDYPAPQTYWPVIGAAYVQDQIEMEDLTLRAGLRFDYFDARSSLPSDLSNPANAIAGAPLSTPDPTTPKLKVSPRLGVAYPITDRIGVHFAYGHFYQYPSIGDIFTNADYSVLARLQAGTNDFGRVMGNPDVEPEQTVQYEFGYKQALSQDFGYEVSAFYKDIRNLLGVEFINTYNDATYARLTNADFGNVLGFTLALNHRAIGPASLSLDYTWQVADGNSSDPNETATRAEAGEDPRPRVVAFNWDQRHTINMTLAISKPDAYSTAAVLRVASGQPYTPVIEAGFGYGLETNSGRKPVGVLLDLRADRWFTLGGQRMSFFGRIFNVFDTRYFNSAVFESTGSPYYSRFPVNDEVALEDPTRLYPPRRIELGFTLTAGR